MIKNVKLIFDSDTLIKLTKANFPNNIFKKIEVHITEEIYDEAVIQGKKRFYADADIIEQLVNKKYLHKGNVNIKESVKNLLKGKEFGKGEISALQLYLDINADAIVSDDKSFLIFLKQNNINFIITADLVEILCKEGFLTKKEALDILEGLRYYIDEQYYINVKKRLEEKK